MLVTYAVHVQSLTTIRSATVEEIAHKGFLYMQIVFHVLIFII